MQYLSNLYHRQHSLGEVPEIFISSLLRTVALSLFGIFVPLYLYQLGYPLWMIALYFGVTMAARIIGTIIATPLVARIGPKHVMLGSTLLLFANLFGLMALKTTTLPIWIPAILSGLYIGAFFLALHDDFSSSMHAGKSSSSIGWYYTLIRVGSAIGPIAGGALATVGGLPLSLGLAAGLLTASMLILLSSPELVVIQRSFSWRDIKRNKHWQGPLSNIGNNIDTLTSTVVWPLFLAVIILEGSSYLELGALATLGSVTALVLGPALSRFIDKGHAPKVFSLAVLSCAIINVARAFTGSIGAAAAFSATKDPAEMSLNITYTKGMYDDADRHDTERLGYLFWHEAVPAIGCTIFWLMSAAILAVIEPRTALQLLLIIGGLLTLMMYLQPFPALNKNSK